MIHQGIERIDDELAALIGAEREAQPSGEALERVRSRLARSLPTGHGGSGPSTGGPGGVFAGLGAKAVIALVALGIGGGAVIAAATRRAASPHPREPLVSVSVEQEVAVIGAPSPSVTVEAPSHPAPPATRTHPSIKAPDLDRERAVLDEARAALRSGDGVAARAAVDRHAQEFPHPELAEEREALAVQALVISRRYDDARARAARFRTTWPSSLFTSSVDASLASIP